MTSRKQTTFTVIHGEGQQHLPGADHIDDMTSYRDIVESQGGWVPDKPGNGIHLRVIESDHKAAPQ